MANTLNAVRGGAVGFIDWLGSVLSIGFDDFCRASGNLDDEVNDPIAKQPQRVCRATLPWLIFFSLGVWQAQSRAGVYAEASAIVYTLGQSRGVTAIAKIAGGLVLLRM